MDQVQRINYYAIISARCRVNARPDSAGTVAFILYQGLCYSGYRVNGSGLQVRAIGSEKRKLCNSITHFIVYSFDMQ